MVLAQPDWSRAAGTVRATRCELVARLSGTGRERALATGFAGLSRWFMARAQQRNWNPDLSIDWRRIRRDHGDDVHRRVAARRACATFTIDTVAPRLRALHPALDDHPLVPRWALDEQRLADCWSNALLACGWRSAAPVDGATNAARHERWGLPCADGMHSLIAQLVREQRAHRETRDLLTLVDDERGPSPHGDPALHGALHLAAIDEATHGHVLGEVARLLLYYEPTRALPALRRVLQHLLTHALADPPDVVRVLDMLAVSPAILSRTIGTDASARDRQPSRLTDLVDWARLDRHVGRLFERNAAHAADAGVARRGGGRWQPAWDLRPVEA